MVARGQIPINVLLVGGNLAPVEAALEESGDGLLGTTVERVQEPSEVEASLDDGSVDCVVAASAGPGTDGRDVLDAVRASDTDVPFVPLVDDDAAASAAAGACADDYLLRTVVEGHPDMVRTRVGRAVAAGTGLGRPGSPDWYDALLEQSMDALTVLDLEGTITYQNPSVDRLLGYEPEELVGRDCLEYVHPEDRDRVRGIFESLYERGDGAGEEIEFRFRAADGSWEWLESIATTRLDRGIGGFVVNSRLVTERKKREREVERYETLLELLPDTVSITDTDGYHVEIYGSEGWSGYTRDELIDEHVSKTIPKDDLERGTEVVQELLENESREKAIYETHVVPKDDEPIPFENHVTLLPPDDDRTPGVMHVLRDISDRKERERSLETAETVFTYVQDGVFLVDVTEDGRFELQRVNPAFREGTGLVGEEIDGKTPTDIAGPELGATIESRLQQCVDARASIEYESSLEMDGEKTYHHNRIAPVIEDGAVVALVGVSRDITDRKARQHELELKNRAMDEAPIGITIAEATDRGPALSYVNDGFEGMTGYREDELLGEGWSILHGEETDPDAVATLQRGIEAERAASAELLIYGKEGTPRWVNVNLAPVSDEDGDVTHFVGFQQDITDLKEYETEIERRFDEFADVFAEELRDPLEAARSSVTAAREDGDRDALDAAAEWLERTDDLLEDLEAVHSFSVPSRERSESALLGSAGND